MHVVPNAVSIGHICSILYPFLVNSTKVILIRAGPCFYINKQRFHHLPLTNVNFPLGQPRVTQCTGAFRDSGVTKVIRFNVPLLGAYNPLEISLTEVGRIGVAGVADLCQVLNNETSAYSKTFVSLVDCIVVVTSFLTEGI